MHNSLILHCGHVCLFCFYIYLPLEQFCVRMSVCLSSICQFLVILCFMFCKPVFANFLYLFGRPPYMSVFAFSGSLSLCFILFYCSSMYTTFCTFVEILCVMWCYNNALLRDGQLALTDVQFTRSDVQLTIQYRS